jgi:5-hydroxyisourate hydrolase
MGTLSTHVLDTALGLPAAGLRIELHQLNNNQRLHLTTAVTNNNGRTDTPLLEAPHLTTGIYELTFHAGDYLRARGISLPDPAFLDQIVIRFGIADPQAKYHVPLLLSPYGYSTYRGS